MIQPSLICLLDLGLEIYFPNACNDIFHPHYPRTDYQDSSSLYSKGWFGQRLPIPGMSYHIIYMYVLVPVPSHYLRYLSCGSWHITASAYYSYSAVYTRAATSTSYMTDSDWSRLHFICPSCFTFTASIIWSFRGGWSSLSALRPHAHTAALLCAAAATTIDTIILLAVLLLLLQPLLLLLLLLSSCCVVVVGCCSRHIIHGFLCPTRRYHTRSNPCEQA